MPNLLAEGYYGNHLALEHKVTSLSVNTMEFLKDYGENSILIILSLRMKLKFVDVGDDNFLDVVEAVVEAKLVVFITHTMATIIILQKNARRNLESRRNLCWSIATVIPFLKETNNKGGATPLNQPSIHEFNSNLDHATSTDISDLDLHIVVRKGSDTLGIEEVKSQLKKNFHSKDLRQLRYFLGIEVAKGRHGLIMSQRKYTQDLLSETKSPCSVQVIDVVEEVVSYSILNKSLVLYLYLLHTQVELRLEMTTVGS
ncbi:hypothetical protein EZV62_014944 [Acer yangbiense]|uniref:Reverse transcriptase Ty1/copia-type domain-containing protein n=1 Tax=Acer yangbiense TaxID=1000413 RepID=A0A5C7HTH5_9ROSI|nr:hypothetical protein EZV62_014944 [Acer yangbiense]